MLPLAFAIGFQGKEIPAVPESFDRDNIVVCSLMVNQDREGGASVKKLSSLHLFCPVIR